MMEEPISLREVLLKLKLIAFKVGKKWVLILIFSLFGAGIGYFYSRTQKPVYRAVTSFVLEENTEGAGGMAQYAGMASMMGLNLGGGVGGIFQGDNLLELYKSNAILRKALLSKVEFRDSEQLLIDSYLKVTNLRDSWKGSHLENIKFYLSEDSLRDRTRDSLLISAVEDIRENFIIVDKMDKKLSIIQVTTLSSDEEFAKLLNEQIVETVNKFYISTKSKKALDNIIILQRQTDSVRNVLNGAIYATAVSADATPNLNPTRQVLRTSGQRSQFTAEANKAILTQLVQNLELAKISLRRETPLIQIIDAPIYPLTKQQLGPRKAAAVGFILCAFLITSFFIIKYILKDILKSE
ncbi:lipopolysaccharide biosynthesis protein [Daejeonella sp. JGW-45]|uniref:lipopolysaccharide biosynthesis protein n=1 Tax=Daejeonella sp. JGW-45 TaxID=3034148 RepID=UPI0023EDFCCC|nr:lipopolysaccharide biosynthesis protein [Daejeonella sp. JGW-45]